MTATTRAAAAPPGRQALSLASAASQRRRSPANFVARVDSWDRYAAPQWLNIRRWLDANPHDELAGEMRAELTAAPARHARYRREYLGWGVFALMNR